MFCVSAEQPVDIPCIAPYSIENSTNVCPIDPLKTAAYNLRWISPERKPDGEEDKNNSLTMKIMKFPMLL